jgi:hypothetical protein
MVIQSFLGLAAFFFLAGLGIWFPWYASLIAFRSASVYKPVGPIYLKGFIPLLFSRIFAAPEDIPNRWAISKAVIPSIYKSIPLVSPSDQVKSLKSYIDITIKRQKGQNDTLQWSKRHPALKLGQNDTPNGQNDTFSQNFHFQKKKLKKFGLELDLPNGWVYIQCNVT